MQRSWRRPRGSFPSLWLLTTLLVFPQGSMGDCNTALLPVFAYSEPVYDRLPASVRVSVPNGYSIKYKCKPGFARIPGRSETTICINDAWSPVQDVCAVLNCEHPVVENGINLNRFKQSYTSGDNVTFECNTGYYMAGSYFIQCVGDKWLPEVPSCKKIVPELCGTPVIPSGTVKPWEPEYSIGSIVALHCKTNYSFVDETIEMPTKCIGYNIWQPSIQPCFIRTSRDTSKFIIHNGKIVSGKKRLYDPGDKVTVQCDAGYALTGPSEIRYVGGGVWLPRKPRCFLNGLFILLITALFIIVLLLSLKMIYKKYNSL
ncbi:complement component receptor 1-like protein [Sceloporus undulatus]|uniref:complement component receptor 1-like protein n=1 Tax=Sceloporus undulatus TaxID=8520 RepID=UPI001C4AFF52|nr:complement component receptor 1-like protein [Sceloporus undulatus]XP_042319679.1 complement component receptor 1-like protein [Sceloporus undulatus]